MVPIVVTPKENHYDFIVPLDMHHVKAARHTSQGTKKLPQKINDHNYYDSYNWDIVKRSGLASLISRAFRSG